MANSFTNSYYKNLSSTLKAKLVFYVLNKYYEVFSSFFDDLKTH